MCPSTFVSYWYDPVLMTLNKTFSNKINDRRNLSQSNIIGTALKVFNCYKSLQTRQSDFVFEIFANDACDVTQFLRYEAIHMVK